MLGATLHLCHFFEFFDLFAEDKLTMIPDTGNSTIDFFFNRVVLANQIYQRNRHFVLRRCGCHLLLTSGQFCASNN